MDDAGGCSSCFSFIICIYNNIDEPENPYSVGGTYVVLDEADASCLKDIVEFANTATFEGVPIEPNKVVVGAALYETNLGALGANWLGKEGDDGKDANGNVVMYSQDAYDYLEQLCRAYDYNMDELEVVGFVNVPYGTDVSKYTDTVGLFTEDTVSDAALSVIKMEEAKTYKLEDGKTYHLFYVLKGKVKPAPDPDPTPDPDPQQKTGGSHKTNEGSSASVETTLGLNNYKQTPAGYVPFIAGDANNAGWGTITQAINANAGKTVAVTMNGTATVDNQVLSTAASTNTSLVFGLDDNVNVGVTPDTVAQILSSKTTDAAGKVVEPFLQLSAASFAQASGSPIGTCGFTQEELASINSNINAPVVKVLTSNTDRSKKLTISFDATKIDLQPGDVALLYGGKAGEMGYASMYAVVDENGIATFVVDAVNGFWTIGKNPEFDTKLETDQVAY